MPMMTKVSVSILLHRLTLVWETKVRKQRAEFHRRWAYGNAMRSVSLRGCETGSWCAEGHLEVFDHRCSRIRVRTEWSERPDNVKIGILVMGTGSEDLQSLRIQLSRLRWSSRVTYGKQTYCAVPWLRCKKPREDQQITWQRGMKKMYNKPR